MVPAREGQVVLKKEEVLEALQIGCQLTIMKMSWMFQSYLLM